MAPSKAARGPIPGFDDDPLRARGPAAVVNLVTGAEGDDTLSAKGRGSPPGPRPRKGPDEVESRGGDDQIYGDLA